MQTLELGPSEIINDQDDGLSEQPVRVSTIEKATAIQELEELIGGELSDEIVKQVESVCEKKEEATLRQITNLESLVNECMRGPNASYLRGNSVIIPPVIDEVVADKIIEQITQQLAEREHTLAGNLDSRVKQLREFISERNPSAKRLQEIATLLDQPIGKLSAKRLALPKYRSRVTEDILADANQALGEFEHTDDLYISQSSREKSGAEHITREIARSSDGMLRTAKQGVEQSVRFDNYTTIPEDSHAIAEGLAVVNEAIGLARQAILEKFADQEQIDPLLQAIARGAIDLEDVHARLLDSNTHFGSVPFGGYISRLLNQSKLRLLDRYPEPSIVGLAYGAQDRELVGNCLKAINKAANFFNVTGTSIEHDLAYVEDRVKKLQTAFFERIDGPESLYFHFSPKGLDIIQDLALKPGDQIDFHMTKEGHSQAVHFVKPGIGLVEELRYYQYAERRLTLGDVKPIGQAFGLAFVFNLGSIVGRTPKRIDQVDANLGKGNVADDVTFRTEDGTTDYSYPLEDAYIVPFASWEQVRALGDDQRFSDLIHEFDDLKPGERRGYDLIGAITRRALELAGFDQGWINQHLLGREVVPDRYQESQPIPDAEWLPKVYASVTKEIQRRSQPTQQSVILPLSAKEGAYELHDTRGFGFSGRGHWIEELVELPVSV